MTILVSGMIAGTPHQGGATWAVLQYVLGLERLGHDVLFVEEVDSLVPASATYFEAVTRAFGLTDRAALIERGTKRYVGRSYESVHAAASDAEIVLNLSGALRDESLLEHAGVRVYVDLDPAFTQLWHLQGTDVGLGGHDRYVTVGGALGSTTCPVPTLGLGWIATRPPVVLERWPAADGDGQGAYTTVANWRSYGTIEHEGRQYGQKAHSLRELIRLPELTSSAFELALAIHSEEERDLAALRDNRWQLVDPHSSAGTPRAYGDYIRASRAEIGIAKRGYVSSSCGWFSDRSACYLASGRPVVAQETGFSGSIPVGEGLLAFATVEEAAAAVQEVEGDWSRHSVAARSLAEAYFDSDLVLTKLLEQVAR